MAMIDMQVGPVSTRHKFLRLYTTERATAALLNKDAIIVHGADSVLAL
jgi:hypothetical protein